MTDNRPQQRDLLTKRWRAVKAPRQTEAQLQIAVVDYLRLMANPCVIYAHCPNGEVRDKRTAAKLKAMGVLPGFPDLIFIKQSGWRSDPSPYVLFLELKANGGKPSPSQVWFRSAAKAAGCCYAIADNIDTAIDVLEQHHMVRPRSPR